jgi:hypothetical protein
MHPIGGRLRIPPMTKKSSFRIPAVMAATAALALGVAACGDDEEESGSSGGQQQSTQSTPEPVAAIDALTGQSTSVKLDAGFVEALGSLKVTPGVLGDAKLANGTVTFPITGGEATYYKPGTVSPYVQGEVLHDGSGLSLKAGGKTVELEDFNVDPGKSLLTGKVSVDGKVAAESAPLFFLDGRTLQPLRTTDDGRAVLEGTTVKLKAEAADLLNQTFGIQDLQEGLVIGTAKLVLASEPA